MVLWLTTVAMTLHLGLASPSSDCFVTGTILADDSTLVCNCPDVTVHRFPSQIVVTKGIWYAVILLPEEGQIDLGAFVYRFGESLAWATDGWEYRWLEVFFGNQADL